MTERYKSVPLICPRYTCAQRGCYTSCYIDTGMHRFTQCKIFKKERNPKRIARLEKKVE